MGKFFVPTSAPEDWKRFLADPEKHWRSGYSAKTLAYCWEEADGFPESVQQVFASSGLERFESVEFLLGFPEHQTQLPGRGRSAQTDVFILAKSLDELMTITVEGKANEGFGDTVKVWLAKGVPDKRNKQTRLKGICDLLGLSVTSVMDIKYQLLHRTAAALIEAQRFNASAALMLVHSFSTEHTGLSDYQAFLSLLGVSGAPDTIAFAGTKNGVELYLAWVTGEDQFLLAYRHK